MKLITAIGTLLLTASAFAAPPASPPPTIPKNAVTLIPTLHAAIDESWKDMEPRSIFAGQIEQESCISLTSKGCWNPRTELKTSREYGFGLGQLTIAYDANGKERFNNFTAMKQQYKAQLGSWKWEDRYNPEYQMMTIILMDKGLYNQVKWNTANDWERYAFMLASYNGGFGGTMKDRTLCVATKGCDPSKWFGNVEKNSFKSRIKVHGYGQSFFDINRGYVDQIMNKRRLKYVPYMDN